MSNFHWTRSNKEKRSGYNEEENRYAEFSNTIFFVLLAILVSFLHEDKKNGEDIDRAREERGPLLPHHSAAGQDDDDDVPCSMFGIFRTRINNSRVIRRGMTQLNYVVGFSYSRLLRERKELNRPPATCSSSIILFSSSRHFYCINFYFEFQDQDSATNK